MCPQLPFKYIMTAFNNMATWFFRVDIAQSSSDLSVLNPCPYTERKAGYYYYCY